MTEKSIAMIHSCINKERFCESNIADFTISTEVIHATSIPLRQEYSEYQLCYIVGKAYAEPARRHGFELENKSTNFYSLFLATLLLAYTASTLDSKTSPLAPNVVQQPMKRLSRCHVCGEDEKKPQLNVPPVPPATKVPPKALGPASHVPVA